MSREPPGEERDQRLGDGVVESQAEHPIAVILEIDLVAVAKIDLLPADLQDRAGFMHLRLQMSFEEAIEMEIVVPLEIDDPHPTSPHRLQAVNNLPVMVVDGVR